MPRLGWRWLLGLSSLPSFILLLFYGITPESPKYLCMKGRTTDAVHILENIARMNQVMVPSGMLISDQEFKPDDITNPSEDAHLITAEKTNDTISGSIESNIGGINTLLGLLSPKLTRSTLLLWMVFLEMHFHIMVLGLLLSAAMVDRIGRKLSVSAMLFISCIFMIPLVFDQAEGLTTALLFGARTCISGSFTIVYIYAPEIYPTLIRSTGVGIASSVARMGGIICPSVDVGLVHGCHQTTAVILFELVIVLSAVAACFFPFETSIRGLSDSEHSLK